MGVAAEGVPIAWNAGFGYTAIGDLCITAAAVTNWINGIAVDAMGRVVASQLAPLQYIAGLGVRLAGQLCVDDVGAITIWNGGIPQVADGSVATTAVV